MTPTVRFAKEVLGFELFPGPQTQILEEIYRDNVRIAVLNLGRRSGKGRLSALIGLFEATANAEAHLKYVEPGESPAVVILATSQRQARLTHKYISTWLRRPALASLVMRETADSLELSNGMTILTLPATAASARGMAIACVILDEAAHFSGIDGSPLDVGEIWRALVPATAQFPFRRIVIASTPKWAGDWFSTLCERAATGDDPETRVWTFSTVECNPAISKAWLAAERARDPVAFSREFEAQTSSTVSAALDAETVRAAIRDGDPLPPVAGVDYTIALDVGLVNDASACLVGHREPEGAVVVDRIASWRGAKGAPVAVDTMLDAVAALSEAYGRAEVVIDQFASEPLAQSFRKRGVRVAIRPWTAETKQAALGALRRLLYGGLLSIPRHKELVSELCRLEVRALPSGRARVAAPGNQHDDFSVGLMALCLELDADSTAPAGATIEPTPAVHRIAGEKPAYVGRQSAYPRWSRRSAIPVALPAAPDPAEHTQMSGG